MKRDDEADEADSNRAAPRMPRCAELSGYSFRMKSSARRALLVLFLLAAPMLACWSLQFDLVAKERVEAGLGRAMKSFATARALNAVVSMLQETTLSVQPMGVGVTTAPGQLLDPINDLIEQFSGLMLGATVSFGLQKALLAVGAHTIVKILVTLALLASALAFALRWQLPRFTKVLLLALLLTRFAVPLAVLGSDAVFNTFLKDEYQSSQQALDLSAGSLQGQTTPAELQASKAQDRSMLDKLKQAATLPDVRAFVERIKQTAEQAVQHLIQLIVVFLLQTLVVPLLLLWLMSSAVRAALQPAASAIRAAAKPRSMA